MSDAAQALYGDGKPAAPTSALSHGTLPSATPAGPRDAASALYGPAPAATAAPRDPAAVKLAQAMRQRGVEPEDEPAAPAPAAQVEPEATVEDDVQQQQQQAQEQEHIEYVPTPEALTTYGAVMRSLIESDVNRLGADPTAAEANATAVAGIFEAFAVNPSDASYIVEVAVAAAANGVTVEKQQQWRRDARDALAAEYPGNVDRVVALGQKLVAKHPSIRAYLAESGLGDSTPVVRAVCAQAWRLAAEGRL